MYTQYHMGYVCYASSHYLSWHVSVVKVGPLLYSYSVRIRGMAAIIPRHAGMLAEKVGPTSARDERESVDGIISDVSERLPSHPQREVSESVDGIIWTCRRDDIDTRER